MRIFRSSIENASDEIKVSQPICCLGSSLNFRQIDFKALHEHFKVLHIISGLMLCSGFIDQFQGPLVGVLRFPGQFS